jgi:hypothetical protein
MFVNHSIKTPTFFGHSCLTIYRRPFSVFMLLLLLCLFASSSCLFGMWLHIIYVCECLMYLSMGGLVVHYQTFHKKVHQALTHIDNIQPHTK